jgi:uncharacterized phage protein (TIGR01671 family)
MMREILFRGKTLLGKWIEGDLLQYLGCGKVNIAQNYKGAGGQEVIPETVGQYTGLTDKNGKKIFEGDIVTNHKGDIGRVTWYEEYCAFMIYSITENKVYWLFDNDFSLIEIIGNIHNNPELLKGGEG